MQAMRCKNCNAELDILQGSTVITCEYCGTQHLPNQEVRQVICQNNRTWAIKLVRASRNKFSLREIQDLIVDFNVLSGMYLDFESLPDHTTTTGAMREFVLFTERRGVLQHAFNVVIAARPELVAILL